MTLRVAHLADLHVGFRQFTARDPKGGNQREVDVEAAVRAAVTDVIAQQPELVVIAGDVFHSVLPPPRAVLFAFSELQRLRAELPRTPVVLISGDHDTPRTSDTGSFLALFRALGITVVHQGIERVRVSDQVVVTAVPQPWASWKAATLAPVAGALNVLLIHSEARAFPGRAIDDELLGRAWDYVALGHWHVCQQVGPRAWYAGALDYTSTDPWGELRAEAEHGLPGKGFLLVELGDDANGGSSPRAGSVHGEDGRAASTTILAARSEDADLLDLDRADDPRLRSARAGAASEASASSGVGIDARADPAREEGLPPLRQSAVRPTEPPFSRDATREPAGCDAEGPAQLERAGTRSWSAPGLRVTFRPIAPPRPFYDLGPLDCASCSAADVDAAIAAALGALHEQLVGAVVRLRVDGVSRATQHALDHALLRAWKARALHLQIEFRRPVEESANPQARRERMKRLDLILDDFLAGRTLPADVDCAALRRLGQHYLQAADAAPSNGAEALARAAS